MNVDADYDDDDLPEIFVNSSAYDAAHFSIPSAEELASQRERELENERKLLELRARHAPRHDSSSSECDAALAAAVTGMSVQAAPPAPRTAPRRAPPAADLLAALARKLPAGAQALLEEPDIAARLPQMVEGASALVAADGEAWALEEVLALGALLAGAALAPDAPPSGARASALRVLHTLLEQRAGADQAQALLHVLLEALPGERARLELSDALRAGGPASAALGLRVLDVALSDMLGACGDAPADATQLDRVAGALSATWPHLTTAKRYTALQLLGRRLALSRPEERGARARVLALLAQAHVTHDTQHPDKLKLSYNVGNGMIALHRCGGAVCVPVWVSWSQEYERV